MSEKIKNLEFLRIIGCLAVIAVHLFGKQCLGNLNVNLELLDKITIMTKNGNMAVDLFFIISGFFFTLKLNTTKTLWQFLKKKLIRLYPVAIFIFFLGWLGHSLFGLYKLSIYDSILILFGLSGTALANRIGALQTGGHQFWYVSAMLWTFLLFYYLLKNYDKKHINLVIAILTYGSYALLVGHKTWGISPLLDIIFNSGMCRAIGGIGIGYFIAIWYNNNQEKIKRLTLNIYQTLFISLIEFMCVFFIVNNLFLRNIKFENKFIFILVYTITIILFLINKGFISRALNKDIFTYISKYTYSIFIAHGLVLFHLQNEFWKTHTYFLTTHLILNILLAFFASIICGVLMYHFIEKPTAKYLNEHWK